MKLHHSKYKVNYYNYLIDIINDNEQYNGVLSERLEQLHDHIGTAFSHTVQRVHFHQATTDFLQGLGLPVEMWNSDIIQQAKDFGSCDDELTEKQEDNICNKYYEFMASRLIELFNKYNIR